MNAGPKEIETVDAVVVGAGFGGLYALYRLRGSGLKVIVCEAGSDIGGTWYWNRYPGARCDVESIEYQYGFSEAIMRGWNWTERYAGQAEIKRYADDVAEQLDLRRDMRFDTRVLKATYDEVGKTWLVETSKGDRIRAHYCVMATGCLSAARVPKIPGLDTFEGDWYHTGGWPHGGVDFTGKTVGVIGTGSSGVQSISVIAEQAEKLFVFQRTPNFSLPALNGPLEPAYVAEVKERFVDERLRVQDTNAGTLMAANPYSVLSVDDDTRQSEFEHRWDKGGFAFMNSFNDLFTNKTSNDIAAEFVRSKIRATVKDPAVANLSALTNHPIGTKRLCLDTHYYETYNRPNVSLVDISKTPVERITPKGLIVGGKEYALDSIVFATGFDAMTGALLDIDIRGKGGLSLRDKWAAGPRTYLGLGTVGFPNLFTVTGPGSPSVLVNMIVAIEQHVDWIVALIGYMRANGFAAIEPVPDAEDRWVEHVNEKANGTLYPQANSWYLGANVPGKPRVFMPYVGGYAPYRRICADVAAKGYEGFALSA